VFFPYIIIFILTIKIIKLIQSEKILITYEIIIIVILLLYYSKMLEVFIFLDQIFNALLIQWMVEQFFNLNLITFLSLSKGMLINRIDS
jgi:hypothetical protein